MKPILYILCGPPGCGKSYFSEHFVGFNRVWISRDLFRFRIVNENENYFSKEKEVFKMFSTTIAGYLRQGIDIIADATHLHYYSRKKLTNAIDKIFKDYQIIYIIFNTPIEEILYRNDQRTGREKVPEEILYKMIDEFSPPYQEDDREIARWTIEGRKY